MLGRKIFYITLGILALVWSLFFMGEAGIFIKDNFVTSERNGLISILTGPFLHGNLNHIIGNTRVLLYSYCFIVEV